ncbi:MAG TPA: hypothetical protein VHI77_03015 [Solirubrobacterales bacterium]|nr:hypothetical protein [Solirubrobacterales bacterium]
MTASLGTYCWNGSSSALCLDAGYPLPVRKRLSVSAGDRVSLRIGAPAARVAVSLLHVAGEAEDALARLRSNPASPRRGTWVTKLPRDLMTGNVLDVSVEYADDQGDADFWVGLREAQPGRP